MNREILFKAKRIDNGEWVEGYYLYCKGATTVSFQNEHYILVFDGFGVAWNEVDRDTICQYTGLTDKNGKRIWENDILCGHGNKDDLAKVVFGKFNVIDVETLEAVDEVEGWHTRVVQTDELSRCLPFCLPMPLTVFYINRSETEVIGNIFDNPELLRGEDDE